MGLRDADEFERPGVPALQSIDNNAATFDEVHASRIHAVAKAAVDAVVQEAVGELTRAVAGATQWLTDTVREEIFSQAVVDAEHPDKNPIEEDVEQHHPSPLKPLNSGRTLEFLNHSPNAIIHALAKATVVAAVREAVKDLTRTIVGTTQRLPGAALDELNSQGVFTPDCNQTEEKEEQDHAPLVDSPKQNSTLQIEEHLQSMRQHPKSAAHAIAEATVDAVLRETVKDLAQTIVGTTQWLADAVRAESVSQAVTTAESLDDNHTEEEVSENRAEPPDETLQIEENLSPLSQSPSAVIHAVAKATAIAVTNEAVMDIVQAIEKASEWISQAVTNELVSESVHSDDGVVQQDDTEGVAQDVPSESAPHDAADTILSSEASISSEEQQEPTSTPEITAVHGVSRLPVQNNELLVSAVAELAKEITEVVVSMALQNVTRAIGGAGDWLTQAACGELLAEALVHAAPEDKVIIDDPENNSTDCEEPQQTFPLAEETHSPVQVPALRLPSAASGTPAECREFAVPFINDVVSSALFRATPASPHEPEEPQETQEPQDYENDEYEDYTPINTPTAEDTPLPSTRPPEQVPKVTQSPPPSTRSPEQEDTQVAPPVIQSGRATPPDTKPTTRRKSPITSRRGLGTPTLKETSPSSAPPEVPPAPIVAEAPTDLSEPEPPTSTLPPLVLPEVKLTGRAKTHPHKTPRKTPRQSSFNTSSSIEAPKNESPRAATTTSCRLNKNTPRASNSADLELTPLSSARAAAKIYAQQPSSPRHHSHHHHKPKKLRDSSSQTSPPPSPPLTNLPRPSSLVVHDDSNGNEPPKTQASHSKHSPRDPSSPENGADKKADRGNNTLLAPLSKTPAAPPSHDSNTNKLASPTRVHKHSRKGSVEGPPPNKRSGYCQRCVFEGRSCKINDCLKHQVLK